ncbi:MAG: hypothetical protein WC822_07215 [Candidatus Paceibacterota bacterium]|jgi:co-chaperonin GroES (HSP10)
MISPVNLHVLIEPVVHDSFIATQKETYEEIGVVVDADVKIKGYEVQVGDKVYFDSWLAAKYPKEGSTDEYFWLVKWEDIRALEHEKQPLPEQPL